MNYARTATDASGVYRDKIDWQPLEDHLRAVSAKAAEFALAFGAENWARLAGLWHDLGKYHPDFQQMLEDVAAGKDKRRVDHSTAGAALVWQKLARKLPQDCHWLLTATVAGHHSGLADGLAALRNRTEDPLHLQRLKQIDAISLPQDIARPQLESLHVDGASKERIEFLTRFVFSVLVDADRLDAELFQDKFLPPDRQRSPLRRYQPLAAILPEVDEYIDGLTRDASSSPVQTYREAVLKACRAAADQPPGAFRLNVETGGGKTLSSLSFALRHAVKHDKRRVIVVIPFTSIIEQTAEVFRNALGTDLKDNVIEHHSAVEEGGEGEKEEGQFDPAFERRRLATENWDAPIIVTTAVQFFESLYSASASRCRKLHNIADSVVILDEAQNLPVTLLKPTVDAINQLTRWYSASVVLSTATQPALEEPFPAVQGVREIVPASVQKPPRRVQVRLPSEQMIEWPALADELKECEQVLCITHKRADARDLTGALDGALGDKSTGNKSTIHLSANMCAEHRSQVIQRIRDDLANDRSCRVVSTQLVEAGVDLDFPVVYRALGGLDAMVQAAGRCNREGKLEGRGRLHIFRPRTNPPPGLATAAKETGDYLFKSAALDGGEFDLFDEQATRRYFNHFYAKMQGRMDGAGITNDRREFRFRTVQEKYRLIEDQGTHSIIVPYGRGKQLAELAHREPSPRNLRALQRYTVNVYQRDFDELDRSKAIEPLFRNADNPSTWVLTNDGMYDRRFGLLVAGTSTVTGNLVISD
ncbi:MAG: CRISPR-associated endonuclease Cas3'' [Planctomycetota bacterium]|nr:CRISPR-associated endonuclease Cas3'' [Planctomycetota bacterium]